MTKNAETQTEWPYKPEPEDHSTSTQTELFHDLYKHLGKHSHRHNFWLQVIRSMQQMIYNVNDV